MDASGRGWTPVDAYSGRRPGIDGSLALAEALLEDIEEALGKMAEFLASP